MGTLGRADGVRLSLAKKHGPAAVNEACAAGLECGAASYRFVRRFLERRSVPANALVLKQIDPLIRQLTLYRDAIERRTQEGDPT